MENTLQENTLQETKEESPLWYENICTDCYESLKIFNIYPDIKWDRIPNQENKPCERCASGDRATFGLFNVDAPRSYSTQTNSTYTGIELTPYRKFRYESTEEFWKSIGFLASHAEVVAFVIERNECKFIEDYAGLKEREPVRYTLIENPDQWGNELRVVVESPSWNFTCGNIVPVNGSGNRINLNSNSLVWWLLEIGFDLGRNHNVESIRSFVPNEFKEAFDEGYCN